MGGFPNEQEMLQILQDMLTPESYALFREQYLRDQWLAKLERRIEQMEIEVKKSTSIEKNLLKSV